jgi:flagellar motor switch protein FliM
VRTSAISIDAVIDRMKISIGDCSRLEVDQIIVLNAGAREQVTLTAETMSGALDFGKGRMGVWKNNRAVQVSAPVSPAFLENIADLDHRAFAP